MINNNSAILNFFKNEIEEEADKDAVEAITNIINEGLSAIVA